MTTPYSPLMQSDQADAEQMDVAMQQALPFQELGVTGLRRSGGSLAEEFLPQLKGRKAIQVYREMADNDPIVSALLFSVDKLIRNADWTVVPAGKSTEHANAAKLLETCMEDMSHSWDDFISEVLSMLTYGWSYHEIVYKRRMGPWQKDGRQKSKYSDGLVGIRKMPIRAQETLQRWSFDPSGSVNGMVQLGPPDYTTRLLPIERGLLFRYGQHKNSPEGKSMLRGAYRPWFYKKRLEEFEAIGVERDLAGLPMVKVPAEWLKAKPGSEQWKQIDAFKKMVRGIRRNEQEGLVFPTAYDDETRQPLFEFELLGSGGARQFETDTLIQRYENRILMTVLADFIMVGHQRVGSYNLHLDKTGIFKTALNATTQSIAEVLNRHMVPRLFMANGWKPAELPYFRVEDVDAPDIAQLGAFLTQTAGLGFNWGPDVEMEKYLRTAAGLPPLQEDAEKKSKRSARWVEATRFATEQTEMLAARSMLAQQMAQSQMQAEGIPDPEQAQAAAQQDQANQQAGAQQEQHGQQAQMDMQIKAKSAQQDMALKEQKAKQDMKLKAQAIKARPKPAAKK